ncbi:alpha/beta-hydrolase [Massarina eburnea CBS 473.64]|uniref:Alpha/beta-hydrolase n=1 Tax=Massarina eburnea CBS 473.64 TaxID=1395130 RepID=A0A6A6RV29_9PLEO|nr:alpha/beta-hydrolase [Massarina eburnea CBS 473.64]
MSEFVQINGAKLAYAISSDDATKPLFITLHGGRGFGSHESDYNAYLPLADKYRILSFDYRGHGSSSRTKPYTFDQLVEDIEGMRHQFIGNVDNFVLCGGSFGGYLAQQYAIKYPEHVSHLILRGTAPSYHHEEEAIKVLEQRLHKAPSLSVNQLKNKIFGHFESDEEFRLVMHAAAPLYSETFDADVALSKTLGTVYFAESHNDLYSEEEKYFDYRENLTNVAAKTLILVGEQDWICPPRQSEIMASLIPDAQLEVFVGANHSVHLEKNKQVIDLIRAWSA